MASYIEVMKRFFGAEVGDLSERLLEHYGSTKPATKASVPAATSYYSGYQAYQAGAAGADYGHHNHDGETLFTITGTASDGTNLRVEVGGGSDSGKHIKSKCTLLFDMTATATGFRPEPYTPAKYSRLKSWLVTPKPYETLYFQWPDYGVPSGVKNQFFVDVVESIGDGKLVVACMGGHGRTGTALAVLRILYFKESAAAAVAWVREHHCKRAVESASQVNWLIERAKEAGTDDGVQPEAGSKPATVITSGNTTSGVKPVTSSAAQGAGHLDEDAEALKERFGHYYRGGWGD